MMQGKEQEPSWDAARFRASVDTDPTKDSNLKEKVCPNIRENETKQLLAAQQITLCPKETNEQTKSNGGYGVITLFDGVSSVLPTLTKKFGYAPTVAILAENDIDIRAVVCAEFGYRADEQWSFTPQGTAALYVKDVHSLIANNCQVLRSTIEAYPDLKWIIVKTTHERCGPFSLVVLSQRRGRVTTSSGPTLSETLSSKTLQVS